jgi:NADH-quinone oxidoreductase subunit A
VPLEKILFLAVFVCIFGALMLALAAKLGLKRSTDPVRLSPYECGIPGQEKKDTKVSVKFYLTAILFILFDIEIIFMYPWAVSFREFISSEAGLFVFGSMGIFLLVFIYGLWWEVKSKALEWE